MCPPGAQSRPLLEGWLPATPGAGGRGEPWHLGRPRSVHSERLVHGTAGPGRRERPEGSRATATPRAGGLCPEAPPPQAWPLSSPQMSQGNPNLGSLLNIKTEAEGSPNVESSPFLGKAAKALAPEKLPEPWKMYLRR